MKMVYESPVMEIYSFDVTDEVMDSSGCSAFQCPDGICVMDGPNCPDFDFSGL